MKMNRTETSKGALSLVYHVPSLNNHPIFRAELKIVRSWMSIVGQHSRCMVYCLLLDHQTLSAICECATKPRQGGAEVIQDVRGSG